MASARHAKAKASAAASSLAASGRAKNAMAQEKRAAWASKTNEKPTNPATSRSDDHARRDARARGSTNSDAAKESDASTVSKPENLTKPATRGLFLLLRYNPRMANEYPVFVLKANDGAIELTIRAKCISCARNIAADNAGDEGTRIWRDGRLSTITLMQNPEARGYSKAGRPQILGRVTHG